MDTTAAECPILLRELHLADLGELAGPLTHEVNNLLNTLTLQLAIWQHTAPANFTDNLQAIHRQISSVAGVVKSFQRYRGGKALKPGLVDLNESLRKVVAEMPASSLQAPVLLELHPELPRVHGYEADVRRLCRFLLANAVRAVQTSQPSVEARTSCEEEFVLLQVEDGGPDVPAAALPHLFDPGQDYREGMCSLELAACRSIMRRLSGRLQAQARPGGGLILTAKFPKEN